MNDKFQLVMQMHILIIPENEVENVFLMLDALLFSISNYFSSSQIFSGLNFSSRFENYMTNELMNDRDE